jgi:hypothetical protein
MAAVPGLGLRPLPERWELTFGGPLAITQPCDFANERFNRLFHFLPQRGKKLLFELLKHLSAFGGHIFPHAHSKVKSVSEAACSTTALGY